MDIFVEHLGFLVNGYALKNVWKIDWNLINSYLQWTAIGTAFEFEKWRVGDWPFPQILNTLVVILKRGAWEIVACWPNGVDVRHSVFVQCWQPFTKVGGWLLSVNVPSTAEYTATKHHQSLHENKQAASPKLLQWLHTFGVFSYFRCKILHHILARCPRFPVKVSKLTSALSFYLVLV